MKYDRLIILLFLVCLIFFIHHSFSKKNDETYLLESYIVQPGDTAWKIMSENNAANKDIRELIYYMEKDNEIQAGYLEVGQEIKIRIYEAR